MIKTQKRKTVFFNIFYLLLLVIVLCSVFLIKGCMDKKVVLVSADGSKKLEYSCKEFRPQAESMDDIKILMKYAPQVFKDAMRNNPNNKVFLFTMSSALQRADFKQLEKSIVEHKCMYEK